MNPRAQLIALLTEAAQERLLTWVCLALFAYGATLILYRALGLAFSGDRSRRLGAAARTLSHRRVRTSPRPVRPPSPTNDRFRARSRARTASTA